MNTHIQEELKDEYSSYEKNKISQSSCNITMDQHSFVKNDFNNFRIRINYKYFFLVIGYLVMISSLFTFMVVNYFITKDAFEENEDILLNPALICKEFIKDYHTCLNNRLSENKTDMCMFYNNRLTECYDQVSSFNDKCSIYLSESNLCLKKQQLYNNTSCNSIINDLIICNNYNYIKINTQLLSNKNN